MWRTKEVCAIAVRGLLEELDLDQAPEAVADVAVRLDALAPGGILERPVAESTELRRKRAHLVLGAERHDDPEPAARQLLHTLRALTRNVDPDLGHRLDREPAYVCGLRARRVHLIPISAECPKQPFGHLRPRAVVHAHEEDVLSHAGDTSERLTA